MVDRMTDAISAGAADDSSEAANAVSDAEVSDAQVASKPSPAGALKIADFRRLWANNVAYFVAFNALRFVFSWYVLDGLNQGEREQGYVVFAIGLPGIFLLLQAGAWADRLNPRLLLIATQAASMVVFAGTAVLIASGRATLGWMLVAAVLAGVTSSLGQPVRASLVPAIVGKEQLFGAIALNALAMTTSMILGPVLVRLVGERFDFDGAFWFLALLLLIGLGFLRSFRAPVAERAPGPRTSVWADTVEALRHVAADPSLRILFLLLSVAGLTVNPAVMITVQAFIKEELGRNSGDAAIPFAMMGIGIAISSVVVMRKGDMANKGAAFQRAMMVGGAMTFLMGLTTEFWQLLPLSFLMGLAGGFYINMNQGLIQSHTPQEIMGRVMGLYTLVQIGFMPLGALILGLVATVVGIGTTISGAAAVALITVCVTYWKGRELRTLS
jgi:DHA3 family macrolide efflux protein-like MFS transporter